MEVTERPLYPDCVIFSSPCHAYTTYYQQVDSDHWIGGLGRHTIDLSALKETRFEFVEWAATFHGQLVRRLETRELIMLAQENKEVNIVSADLEEPLKLDIVSSVKTEEKPVHFDQKADAAIVTYEAGRADYFTLTEGGLVKEKGIKNNKETIWCGYLHPQSKVFMTGADTGYYEVFEKDTQSLLHRIRQ